LIIGILNLRHGFAAKFIKFKADLGAADGLAAQRRADAAMEFILPICAAAHVD
jgi:hypothetical protein